MRLLILGGTGFIGQHQLRHALSRGHRVTVFNRGSQHGVPDDVEQLLGDRNGDLSALQGRTWDACIDNPTSLPIWVRRAADMLVGNVGHYVFVSTISTYASDDAPADETAPSKTYEGADPMAETSATLLADPRLYGPLKALCEREARSRYGDAATSIVRSGLIVGPGDHTDHFTYWPVRMRSGGNVLAPGDGSDPVQLIDVRDLAEWTVRLAEAQQAGVFNATGPAQPIAFRHMLAEICAATGAHPVIDWAPTAFIEEHGVSPWTDMPVWLPGHGETAGFHRRDISRAKEAGLTFRSLSITASDTLSWFDAQPPDRRSRLRAGLTPEREADLLARLLDGPEKARGLVRSTPLA